MEIAGKRAVSMRHRPSGQSLAVVRGCGSPITSSASENPKVQKLSANELPRDCVACDEDLLDASLRSEDELAGVPPSDEDACGGVFREQAASIDHIPCGQKPAVDRGCSFPINIIDWMRSVDRDFGTSINSFVTDAPHGATLSHSSYQTSRSNQVKDFAI